MRKTNLFYLKDNTSNFLTFSNYGEYLTGVVLSTNHKIYPSSFICLNLDFDEEDKSIIQFKQFLMRYYENKLAWLRDQYDKENHKWEEISELNLLFQAIYLFFDKKIPDIQYFGDIVEHDYTGTYSDSICIVDFKRYRNIELSLLNNDNIGCNTSTNDLYGWDVSLEISDEGNDEDIYKAIVDNNGDNNKLYNYDEIFDINILESPSIPPQIKFNCVIPLFDINDLNYSENNYQINEENLNIVQEDIYQHIPYGIWLTKDKDTFIELNQNSDNISQSWSLVISSKFSPYPYGLKINDKLKIDNDQQLIKHVEQYTYSELLAKQSEILNVFNQLITNFNDLSNKVNAIEKTMHEINALDIDNIKLLLNSTQVEINNKMNNLKTEIDEKLDNLRWKSINTYKQSNE